MGRKKKTKEVSQPDLEDDDRAESPGILHHDVKRSIAAVFLFTLGILFALGFFKSAGILGTFFDRVAGLGLGWGKWIFPFLLFLAGIFLFRRRTSSWSDAVKLGGLSIAFLSFLGFLHSLQSGDLAQLAVSGRGGGYIGFGLASLFGKLAGTLGGTILFVALFLIGTIAAFNFSLLRFSDSLSEWTKRRDLNDVTSDDEAESEKTSGDGTTVSESIPQDSHGVDVPIVDPIVTEKEKLEQENIKRIHFPQENEKNVEGRNAEAQKHAELASVPAYFLSGERKPFVVTPRRSSRKRTFWQLPTSDLLDTSSEEGFGGDTEARAEIIRQTLENFGIPVVHHATMVGPTVTQYMFSPAGGVKLSRITTLSDNLALAMEAPSIRIQAPIPGKALIGIEVPNQVQAIVRLRNILESQAFLKRSSALTVALGKDVHGDYAVADIGKMPHLLVAGTTRSGKSVFINALLLSLLYQNAPDDLRLILIDPKRVELSLYNGIPHLITDVIVEPKKVVNALRSMVGEMDRRYKLLEQVGSRDIESYHVRCARGERRTVPLPGGGSREEDLPKLPYIVIVIDEMADLMMSHGREVEGVIVRLAQMARAVGIHLVLATQRPSVEVITGLIKANIVTRIAFQVATQIDSRTILDQGGAEKLIGQGDMLFTTAGYPQPRRIQGPFVSEDEVRNVVEFIREQKLAAGFEESIDGEISTSSPIREREFALPSLPRADGNLEAAPVGPDAESFSHPEKLSDGIVFSLDDASSLEEDQDPRYEEARQVVLEFRQASTSFLQRRMGLGYSRAAKIIDCLEKAGVVGPKDGSKPREILASSGTPANVSSPIDSSVSDSDDEDLPTESAQDDKWQV
ncbi:MAG: DNA translocase FtsK 4TM domain-containing protein [Candidatus Moraniibacteriota bacterium]|nr:MAG: DNA translocase FtsK 4TM domain-containing protein [Candidatus Moranbacteria bacterium]